MSDVDAAIQSILLDGASLTQKLKVTSGNFIVKRIAESFIKPDADMQLQFSIFSEECVFSRTVALCDDDCVLVLAQTIVPPNTLQAVPELLQLGDKPLGAFLFSLPGCSRNSPVIQSQPDWEFWKSLGSEFLEINFTNARVRESFFTINSHLLRLRECFLTTAWMRLRCGVGINS